jgi:CRISPR-associated exonuclease Cas4
MSDEPEPGLSTELIVSSGIERGPEDLVRKHLVDAISNRSFNEWYQEQQFTENILEGRPYFNGASPPPEPERHSPSKLLQCHRKVSYYKENAPKEGDSPQGLFWVGTQFEEDIVVPYLLEAATTENTYVQNSMWIDTTIEIEEDSLQVRGVTDPVIVDAAGEPLLVTEIKTTSSLEYLAGPKPHHKAQLHAYLYALNEEYEHSIRDGLLLYGARDTLDIKAYHVPFDETFWNEGVIAWMRAQTAYRESGELPPANPVFDWECSTCPFQGRCGEGDAPYQDVGYTGLLPGFAEYRKQQLTEYFDAYPSAKLTPTLAHEYPSLVDEQGVYEWRCTACGSTYAWDGSEEKDDPSELPLCTGCAENGELTTLTVPSPENQSIGPQ